MKTDWTYIYSRSPRALELFCENNKGQRSSDVFFDKLLANPEMIKYSEFLDFFNQFNIVGYILFSKSHNDWEVFINGKCIIASINASKEDLQQLLIEKMFSLLEEQVNNKSINWITQTQQLKRSTLIPQRVISNLG